MSDVSLGATGEPTESSAKRARVLAWRALMVGISGTVMAVFGARGLAG